MPLMITKDYETILKNILTDMYNQSPLINLAPASKYRAIIEIFARYLSDTYNDVDNIVANTYITDAEGIYLDALAISYGLTRRQATTASIPATSKTVKFYTIAANFGAINNGNDIQIPARTEIRGTNSHGEDVIYRTTEDITLPATAREYYVGIEALGSGSRYNLPAYALNKHSFDNYADAANNSLLVMNSTDISLGQDDESDENLRYRILHHIQSIATANKTAVEIAALTTPGVSDVKIIDQYYGTGTAKVVVKAVTPLVPDSLVNLVQKSIDGVKPIGSNVIASKPYESMLIIKTKLSFKDNTTEQTKIEAIRNAEDAIVDFINNMDIGQTLYVTDLVTVVVNSDPSISGVGSKGKFFDVLSVSKETALGHLNLTIKGDKYTPDADEKLFVANDKSSLDLGA